MKLLKLTLSLLVAFSFATAARAVLVTVDTSTLFGGLYHIDFQLNDGNGVGDGNNSAVISGFSFGGGAVAGAATSFGGVSGDLSSAVTLIDTDPFNEFFQAFNPGSTLSFTVQLSNNANGAIPDFFGFALLDENLMNLATYSLGSDQLLTVDINGGALTYDTYASVGGIPSPTVAASVPERGSTLVLVLVAVLGTGIMRRHQVRLLTSA
jgi:hypothetical protein